MERESLVGDIINLILDFEDKQKESFIFTLPIIITRYLEYRAEAEQVRPLLWEQSAKTLFELQILPKIISTAANESESAYLISLLLEKLITRVTTKYYKAMEIDMFRRNRNTAGDSTF